MKIFQKLLAVSLLLLLTGCWGAWSESTDVNKFNNDSYLKAKSIHPLIIPPELASTTYIEPYYPAPPGEYPEPGEASISALPPGLGEVLEEDE